MKKNGWGGLISWIRSHEVGRDGHRFDYCDYPHVIFFVDCPEVYSQGPNPRFGKRLKA